MSEIDKIRALLALGRNEAAVEAARSQMLTSPNDPGVVLLLGLALSALGDHRGAVDAAGTAVGLDPESAWMHTGMSAVLRGAGRDLEAVDHARRAEALAPAALGPKLALAWSCRVVDRELGATAAAAALDLAPDSVEALRARALYASRFGAARLLERALELEPDNPDLLRHYALALESTGRHDAAVVVLRDTLGHHPTRGDVANQLNSAREQARADVVRSARAARSYGPSAREVLVVALIVVAIWVFFYLVSGY